MQQLHAYRFYELGAKLHKLFCSSTQGRVADMFSSITEAQTTLDSFIKGDVFALETSKADATKLLNKLGAVFNRYYIDASTKQLRTPDSEDRIDNHELSLIHSLIEKFEHALAAELNRAPTYVAGKRGIYATFDLAENAQHILPETLRLSMPASVSMEMNEAGRSLAFGLGTAAAMHLLRAIEIMLKQYFEAFVGSAGPKNERNYTAYVKRLAAMSEEEEKEGRPDRRVVQTLAQIRDQYRSPLLAPEQSISLDEATQFLGVAAALIAQMAEQINARKKVQTKSADIASISSAAKGEDEDDAFDFRLSQAG